jgi:hypothetical protein
MGSSMRSSFRLSICLVLPLIVIACGGGNSAPAPSPPPPPGATALISGSESALVSAVLIARTDKPLTDQEVSNGFLLSRLLVTFKVDATVGQANAAARAVGATRITSAEPGSLLVVLEVPRQTDAAGIQSLAKTLRAQPGITFAWPGKTATPSVLPEFSAGIPVSTVGLGHLLGNRFPQAWNARQAIPSDCLPRSVSVYVIDQFGDPSTRPTFFQQFDRSSFIVDPNGMSSSNTGDSGHGYDVAATLAAKFDADTPTGANPFADCVIVHAIEVKNGEYVDALRRAVHAVAADSDPRVILTSSLVFSDSDFCGINGVSTCDATTINATLPDFILSALYERAAVAAEWARLIRTTGIIDKALITQSAGNVAQELPRGFLAQNYLGFRSASWSSPAALATHLHELRAMLTDSGLWTSSITPTLPDFTASAADVDLMLQTDPSLDGDNSLDPANLLIVDSGTSAETPSEIHQSEFDFLGATVRAVGQNVVLDGQVVDGTSFSTPLVAGLAAYLWNLAPTLAAQPASATADLLKRSSVPTATVPIIDAYAAVLRLDDIPGCCVNKLPGIIRAGLLDVDADGEFTSLDLQKFATAYGLTNPDTPTIPSTRDYSRFDLNGDGFTGGIITTAFDLDVNGLDGSGHPRINSVDEQVESYPISFNEAALSDLQVLCYYAYSPLYPSDNGGQNDQLRTSILGPDHCVGARMIVELPAQISSSTTLHTTVEVPAGNGSFAAAPNILVDMTPTCATVSPTSGRTDANGAITATVTPSTGCGSISIQLVARADAGTTPLALGTATAVVAQSRAFPGRYEVIAFTALSLGGAPRDIPLVESIGTPFPSTFSLLDPLGLNCSPGPTGYDLSTSAAPAGLDFTGNATFCGQSTLPQPSAVHVRGSWNSASGELHIIFFHDVLPDGGTLDTHDLILLPCSTPAKPGFIECSSPF